MNKNASIAATWDDATTLGITTFSITTISLNGLIWDTHNNINEP